MNLATLAQRQAERYGDRAAGAGERRAGDVRRPGRQVRAVRRRPAGARHPARRPGRRDDADAARSSCTRGSASSPPARSRSRSTTPRAARASPTSSRPRARAPSSSTRSTSTTSRSRSADVETLEQVIVTGPQPELDKPVVDFAELLGHEPAEPVERKAGDPASILFTGGTTGPPKGVVLPHNHNLNLAQGVSDMVGYTEDDVLYSVFPLFHANAKYMTVLAAMLSGAKCVIHKRFSASRFWDICAEHGVTAFNGQGEMLRILLKQPERDSDRTNSVRVVVGAAAATDLVVEFEQRFGLAVLDAYGMTETGPTIMVPWDKRRPGAAGLPTPWYEVRARRRGRQRRPRRRDGGDRRAAAQAVRDDGALLGQRRGDARVDGQPVVPHGRQRLPGRGRVLLVRRPRHGLDPAARRERLRLGGRARARRPRRAARGGGRTACRRRSAARRSWWRSSGAPSRRSRPSSCSTTARGRCRTSRFRATSASWTRCRARTPSACSSRSSRRTGADAAGVWDREAVGYVVQR